MNWPPLSAETTKEIAEVLRASAQEKPIDLIEFVAQRLQDRSGISPSQFTAQFDESSKKPRTYVLEDRCPDGADPLVWVPMRYNDETILGMQCQRALGLCGDILTQEPLTDMNAFLQDARVAYPEISYLRGTYGELEAFQTLRALYLCCSGCPSVVPEALGHEDPNLAFQNEAMISYCREQLFEVCTQNVQILDALLVLCVLRIVGSSSGFQMKFGGGLRTAEAAVLHAIESEPEVLPSYQRLDDSLKQLIIVCLRVHFPLDALISTEVVPAHFARVKEVLVPKEGAVSFFLAGIVAEHIVQQRGLANKLGTDKCVDDIRLSVQCLVAVNIHTPQRAYELYLKKRGEQHGSHLMREDFMQRAVIRLCCFAGLGTNEAWAEMMQAIESLAETEKEVLRIELGQQDGVSESPVYFLCGASELFKEAQKSQHISSDEVVRLLARLLDEASLAFNKAMNQKVIKLHLGALVAGVQLFQRSEENSFSDIETVLQELDTDSIQAVLAS